MQKKIFIVERHASAKVDEAKAFTIIAFGETEARAHAVANSQDEGPEEWGDPALSTVMEIGVCTDELLHGIVCRG